MLKNKDLLCLNCGSTPANHGSGKKCPDFKNNVWLDSVYTPGYIIDKIYSNIFDELDKVRFYLIRKEEKQSI